MCPAKHVLQNVPEQMKEENPLIHRLLKEHFSGKAITFGVLFYQQLRYMGELPNVSLGAAMTMAREWFGPDSRDHQMDIIDRLEETNPHLFGFLQVFLESNEDYAGEFLRVCLLEYEMLEYQKLLEQPVKF